MGTGEVNDEEIERKDTNHCVGFKKVTMTSWFLLSGVGELDRGKKNHLFSNSVQGRELGVMAASTNYQKQLFVEEIANAAAGAWDTTGVVAIQRRRQWWPWQTLHDERRTRA
ncbi:hypothetical protein BHM03_00019601 [Ensete ventricosum]|nr:hypothetical protein BHM03_00019601 [Ensete ventricosum]